MVKNSGTNTSGALPWSKGGFPPIKQNLLKPILDALEAEEWGLACRYSLIADREMKLSNNDFSYPQVLHERSMDPLLRDQGMPYVKNFHDVTVDTSYWSVINKDTIHISETSGANPKDNPFIRRRSREDFSAVVFDRKSPVAVIDTPCLLVGGDTNYSHWMSRYFPRIAITEGYPMLESLPVLVREPLLPFQDESLSLFGYPEERRICVPADVQVHVALLWVPTHLRLHRHSMVGIKWLRETAMARLNLAYPPPGKGKRLYLSRDDASYRHLLNEPELMAKLQQLGFEKVTMSGRSISDQIALFSQAECIVGVHGAAMNNIVFSPTHCCVLELTHSNLTHMADLISIGETLKMPYGQIWAHHIEIPPSVDPKMVSVFELDFACDISAILTQLKNLYPQLNQKT